MKRQLSHTTTIPVPVPPRGRAVEQYYQNLTEEYGKQCRKCIGKIIPSHSQMKEVQKDIQSANPHVTSARGIIPHLSLDRRLGNDYVAPSQVFRVSVNNC